MCSVTKILRPVFLIVLTIHKIAATCDATCLASLKKGLLTDYDRFIRPSEITKLKVSITVLHTEIEEQKNIFTVYGWTKLEWNDERLQWNTSQYGGRTMIHMMDHEIWQPDLEVYNTAVPTEADHFGQVRCLVYNVGTVLCVPPSKLSSICEFNLRNWPYDVQRCMIKIGSWTYSNLEIDLQLEKSEIQLMVKNPGWKILKLDSAKNLKYYPCCEEPYPDIEFNFTIYRASELQKAITLTPVPVVMLSTLGSFWLPANASEKIIIHTFNSLILIIFLKYFAGAVPDITNHIPSIVHCYTTLLYSTLVALIISIIAISMARSQNRISILPICFKRVLESWYANLLGVKSAIIEKQPKAEEMHNASLEDTEASTNSFDKTTTQNVEWCIFATLFDRSAFLLFCVFFIVIAFEYVI